MSREVYDTGTLIEAARRQGVDLHFKDAEILLNYMGIDDRHLMTDACFNLSIQDYRNIDTPTEHLTDIHGVLMLAMEINASLIEYLTKKVDQSTEDTYDLRTYRRERKYMNNIGL